MTWSITFPDQIVASNKEKMMATKLLKPAMKVWATSDQSGNQKWISEILET